MTWKVGGKISIDMANHVQKELGGVINFECTRFTRKDKYMHLGGNHSRVFMYSQENEISYREGTIALLWGLLVRFVLKII